MVLRGYTFLERRNGGIAGDDHVHRSAKTGTGRSSPGQDHASGDRTTIGTAFRVRSGIFFSASIAGVSGVFLLF